MTKFETIGVSMQYDACSKANASKKFKQSCNVCCSHGIQLQCDHCAIKAAHELTMAILSDIEREKINKYAV